MRGKEAWPGSEQEGLSLPQWCIERGLAEVTRKECLGCGAAPILVTPGKGFPKTY
jgi:hypothetical protein